MVSIGLSGGTLSLSQYRQYRLGSLTRDTIPLTADFVTLSHYLTGVLSSHVSVLP